MRVDDSAAEVARARPGRARRSAGRRDRPRRRTPSAWLVATRRSHARRARSSRIVAAMLERRQQRLDHDVLGLGTVAQDQVGDALQLAPVGSSRSASVSGRRRRRASTVIGPIPRFPVAATDGRPLEG